MNEAKFIEQIDQYKNDWYVIARSILKNHEDAEDIVQEALLIAFEKLGTLRKEEKFKAWMTRIVINQAKMHIRKSRKLIYVEHPGENREVQMTEPENDDIWEITLSMKKEWSVPTILYYAQGYSLKEISDILRIPVGTVKSRLAKARQILKEKLEDSLC